MHSEFIYKNENKENFDNRMFDTTIEELDLTRRAYNVLKRNNLLTVNDIIKFGPSNIIGLRNAGKKTAKEVSDTILHHIQSENIPSPNEDNSNLSEAVETIVPTNYSTFEDLIRNTSNQEILNTPIEELDISVRGMGALKKAGLNTIEDIVDFGLINLRTFKNVGRNTIEEIKNAIKKCGEWGTDKGGIVNSIDTINSILASVSPKHLDIIKLRYGYRDGKRQTLEEIGNKKGITRESSANYSKRN